MSPWRQQPETGDPGRPSERRLCKYLDAQQSKIRCGPATSPSGHPTAPRDLPIAHKPAEICMFFFLFCLFSRQNRLPAPLGGQLEKPKAGAGVGAGAGAGAWAKSVNWAPSPLTHSDIHSHSLSFWLPLRYCCIHYAVRHLEKKRAFIKF